MKSNALRRWEPAQGEPGEVVLAVVGNPIENPGCLGKVRPVVLVRREGASWHVMGLTTQARYKTTGAPRRPVPNPARVGLLGEGFLWAERLTGICVLNLQRHLGWADTDLAEAIIEQAQLGTRDAAALRHVRRQAA